MEFPDSSKATMLDAWSAGAGYIGAASAYPTTAGSNELSGGVYARQAHTWNAAASGNLDNSNAPEIPIPAGSTPKWYMFWSASSAGTYRGCVPVGSTGVKPFQTDATANKILCPGHGYTNGKKVVFYRGTVPGGLTLGVDYWVVGATTDDFQVSATEGGSAIDLTSANALGCRVSNIIVQPYVADGFLRVTDVDIGL